jgi:hypothetical protein
MVPGLMNLRDKGGNLAQVVYNSAVQLEGPHVVSHNSVSWFIYST